VAWILLQSEGEPEVAGTASAPAEGTWILLGDLTAALYQAGYIGELLANGRPPERIVGAGFGAINAILASPGRADLFTRGWERLRSRHFIMTAALEATSGLAARFSSQDSIVQAAKYAAAFVDTDTRAEVLLVSGERFIACTPDEGSRAIDLLGPALRRTDVEPDTVSAAINAAGQSRGQTLVWGPDQWTASSPLVHKAIEDAAASATTVGFVEADPQSPASLIELLLPGSGAVERTMARGRAAAHKQLASSAA
jgi:hypothetical protein